MTESLTTWTPIYDRRSAEPRTTDAPLRPAEPGVAIAAGSIGFAPVLRSTEPVPAELHDFVTRKLSALFVDRTTGVPATLVPLSALMASGEPWPTDLALLLVRRIATLLDTAERNGMMLGTFTAECVAFHGPHVALAHHDDRAGLDPAYVAPEQLRPGTLVDARASQYGLALVAATLLTRATGERHGRDRWYGRLRGGAYGLRGRRVADVPDPHLGPAVRNVLRTARNADPARRFPTAGEFVAALEHACVEWWASEPTTAGAPSWRAVADARTTTALALSCGAAIWWLAARHPADAIPPELRDDSAGRRVIAALSTVAPSDANSASTDLGVTDTGASAASDRALLAGVGLDAELSPTTLMSGFSGLGSDQASWDSSAPGPSRQDAARPSAFPTKSALSQSALDARLGALAQSLVRPGADAATRADLSRRLTDPDGFATGEITRTLASDQGAADSPAPTAIRDSIDPWVGPKPKAVPGSDGPRYPAILVNHRVQGEVVARFVIDSTGRVDPHSFEVVRSTHVSFTSALRESLPRLRYVPPERDGHPVAQTVEQTFRFVPPR